MAETTTTAGVLTGAPAIQAALASQPAPASKSTALSDLETIDKLSPATQTAASGALIEPEIVDRVKTSHPAIDDTPRAGQCVAANRIDMNDPTVPGHVQTARNLGLPDDYADPKTAADTGKTEPKA